MAPDFRVVGSCGLDYSQVGRGSGWLAPDLLSHNGDSTRPATTNWESTSTAGT